MCFLCLLLILLLSSVPIYPMVLWSILLLLFSHMHSNIYTHYTYTDALWQKSSSGRMQYAVRQYYQILDFFVSALFKHKIITKVLATKPNPRFFVHWLYTICIVCVRKLCSMELMTWIT